VAVGRSSESEADRFFVGLLGLERTRVRDLPEALSERFFGRVDPCRMIDYERDGVRFEVFVPDAPLARSDTYGHACLVVEDREDLLERAAGMGVERLAVERDGRTIVFLRDADGNLFEIQQAS